MSLPAPLCGGPGPEASMGKGSGFGVSGVTFGQALYLPAQHASGRGVVPAPCSPAPSSLPPGDTETPAVVTAQGASGCEGVGARDAGQHPSERPHPRERWDPRSAVPGGGFELMGSDRTPQGPVREGAFAGAGGVTAEGASCRRSAQCRAAPVHLGSLHPSPCRAKGIRASGDVTAQGPRPAPSLSRLCTCSRSLTSPFHPLPTPRPGLPLARLWCAPRHPRWPRGSRASSRLEAP